MIEVVGLDHRSRRLDDEESGQHRGRQHGPVPSCPTIRSEGATGPIGNEFVDVWGEHDGERPGDQRGGYRSIASSDRPRLVTPSAARVASSRRSLPT